MEEHSEEKARREAVRRVPGGEPVSAVAATMARFGPTDPAWAWSQCRAPTTVANRTDVETKALVLKVRKHLAATRGRK